MTNEEEDQPGHPLAHSLFPLVDSLLNYDTGKYFATEDFHAYADKTLAGGGGSGSGKWTRVKLPRRFYQPGRGTIRIDGQDIGKVTQRSLREASAYNIVYGPQHRLSIAAVATKIAPVSQRQNLRAVLLGAAIDSRGLNTGSGRSRGQVSASRTTSWQPSMLQRAGQILSSSQESTSITPAPRQKAVCPP